MSEQLLLEKAKYVVEDLLKADSFINKYQKEIYKSLERQENRALDLSARSEEANISIDGIFIAISLPIISSIIHSGCDSHDFENAKQRISEIMPGANAESGLSALTFIYIVERAWQQFQSSSKEHERMIWECIRSRVRRWL
jgi:hypothetical protein